MKTGMVCVGMFTVASIAACVASQDALDVASDLGIVQENVAVDGSPASAPPPLGVDGLGADSDGNAPSADLDGGAGDAADAADGGAVADTCDDAALAAMVKPAPPPSDAGPSPDGGIGALGVPAAGLIGHWRGNGCDDSGHRRHAAVHGVSLAKDRFGAMAAGHYDGTSALELAQLADVPQGNAPWTISVWFRTTVKRDGLPSAAVVGFGGSAVGASAVTLGVAAVGAALLDVDGKPTSYGVPYVVDGSWHHVAITYDGAKTTTFVEQAAVQTAGSVAMSLAGLRLVIGAAPSAGSSATAFEGDIDDVRLWDRALSQEEIDGIVVENDYFNVHCYLADSPAVVSPGPCPTNPTPTTYTVDADVRTSMNPDGKKLFIYTRAAQAQLRSAANGFVVGASGGATLERATYPGFAPGDGISRRVGNRTAVYAEGGHTTGYCRAIWGHCRGIGTTSKLYLTAN